MLTFRRLMTWLLEISLEMLLLGLLLITLSGYQQYGFVKTLFVFVSGVALILFTTGYVLSTAISRLAWRGEKVWSYPMFSTALFFLHFEFFNLAVGGAFEPSDRGLIRLAGACIAFACTLVGSHVLARMTESRTKANR